MSLFSGQEWVFQQDSVPAQRVKTTQEWLRRNLWGLHWLSGSADLKPLDNKLWAVLEDMLCQKWHNSLRSLIKATAEIPLETERAVLAEWLKHLRACIEA
jgi:hypothetical protein